MSGLSRRQVIAASVGGVATTVGLGLFGAWALRRDETPAASDARTPIPTEMGPTTTTRPPKLLEVRTVKSTARNRDVEVVAFRPDGVAPGTLPVCLALHGRGARARVFTELGVGGQLSAAAAYAVVAVDGGDSYWVGNSAKDDPVAMLTDELPGWLADLGLNPRPFAVLGVSMGAYGALNYVREHPDAVRAAAVISPALFTSWGDARARNVFTGRAQWEQTEPLRHIDALGGAKLGVWCGTADPLLPSANRLIDTARPAVARTAPGGHDADYWTAVVPEALSFIGSHI
ncbi:alpha/beta hydrolase [Actinokineospora diospyrosa]|uniref:Acyl-CoA:diacylglycerol acyltransferase n=1 Tax=Actinokineospora diospyrosa TaxID=103728 RepID=A0ABT1IJV9_9PSEU|nr:alpha/beta hydrolase-fold protein [Actinokineospora diospyrosa]MCP2272811.1 S-formylglutathione hydrolase FrmB [Actinokineospora diospyrosa]